MTAEEVASFVRNGFPGSRVRVEDMTGTGDHFEIFVTSPEFRGKTLMDQHRMVQKSIQSALDDGSIHAVRIKTLSPEQDEKPAGQDDFNVLN